MSNINISKLGWKRDSVDPRDFNFADKIIQHAKKASIDLRDKCPVVVDQGDANSCVGNSVASLLQIRQIQQGKVYYDPAIGRTRPYTDYIFAPSRLFVYYGARTLDNTQNVDGGAQIRNAIKFVAQNGAATSSSWPYHIGNVNIKPTDKAYEVAKSRGEVFAYYRIDTEDFLSKVTALSQGFPFVFGFLVYSNFLSSQVSKTGKVNMPSKKDTLVGGHAVVGVGIDSNHIICRNSWGDKWGDHGYFYLPLDYINNTNLAGDFWVVTQVE